MLKIKNGRLQVAGIEFSMPDGFFIDVEGKQLRQYPNPFWVRDFTPLHR